MSQSDNKFGKCCNCPSLMGGDRLFTNHLLNSRLNAHVTKLTQSNNHHEMRHYLQNNAVAIMDNERKYLNNTFRCNNSDLSQNSSCNSYSYAVSGNDNYL